MSDGEQLFLSQLDVIERAIASVCRRRRVRAEDVDDFASEVKRKLIEKDYARLRKFEGRSKLFTYLVTVAMRVLIDERNARFGKWRSSARARADGRLSVLLERLMWRDGFSFEEACETIITNHGFAVSRQELEERRARLPDKARREIVSDDALDGLAGREPPVDETLIEDEEARQVERLFAALQAAIRDLESLESLLIASYTEDGESVANIGRLYRLSANEQKKLYGIRDRLCEKLRKILEDQGFDSVLVRKILVSDRHSE